MSINKVVYGNDTLIDLTEDTVAPENLLSGATAHNAAGNPITGTARQGHDIYYSGSTLPMAGQPNLKFEDVKVENDDSNHATVIKPQFHVCATKAEWDAMSPAEQNDPLVYWVRPWASSFALDSDRTPVGTVVSIGCDLSTIDPQDSLISFPNKDYLICKGTVCYISSYPQLANYIESAYGSKNYFGGDGTTTFAIPDWSADFPENGILCIKAQISSTAITFAEIDETGIYAGEDKVPSCARVAEIEADVSELGLLSGTLTLPSGATGLVKWIRFGNLVHIAGYITYSQQQTSKAFDLPWSAAFRTDTVGHHRAVSGTTITYSHAWFYLAGNSAMLNDSIPAGGYYLVDFTYITSDPMP